MNLAHSCKDLSTFVTSGYLEEIFSGLIERHFTTPFCCELNTYLLFFKQRLAFHIGMPESGYRILPVSPRISLVSQITNVEQSDFDSDHRVHTEGFIAETGLTNDLNSSTIKSDTVNIISNIKLHP